MKIPAPTRKVLLIWQKRKHQEKKAPEKRLGTRPTQVITLQNSRSERPNAKQHLFESRHRSITLDAGNDRTASEARRRASVDSTVPQPCQSTGVTEIAGSAATRRMKSTPRKKLLVAEDPEVTKSETLKVTSTLTFVRSTATLALPRKASASLIHFLVVRSLLCFE